MSRQNIAYWIATGLFAFVMTGSGVMHLIHAAPIAAGMKSLGYPLYLSTLLGVAKLLGVAALLTPAPARLKEWAYAGFAFDIIGATWSHFSSGQSLLPSVIVLLLFLASYLLFIRRVPSPVAVAA